MSDHSHDEISALGEFGLIRHLTKNIRIINDSTVKGVGDDSAILDYKGKKIVVSTDMLTEGIHFNMMYTPLKHLGYKAAVVNFSDIYAMNAHPKQLFVSLAVSRKFNVGMIEEIYKGILLACEKYGVDLAGGDTNSSLTGLTLSLTAIGEGMAEKLVYRNGAGDKDLICVSGDLGGAYLGLQLLERERRMFEKEKDVQPNLEGYDYVLERQLKPEAGKTIIDLFDKIGIIPTSMIDISDGLSSELFHICSQSEKGCKIFADKIPIHSETRRVAKEFNLEPVIAALNGGEDYELLFTVPVRQFDKIGERGEFTIIGHVTSDPGEMNMITREGQVIRLEAQGWNSLV